MQLDDLSSEPAHHDTHVERRAWILQHSLMMTKIVLLAIFSAVAAVSQTATITWTNVHQTMDGFGVSDAFQGSTMASGDATNLFSTASGAGFSFLRTQVSANLTDLPGN